ncbi:WD40 repeat-like protein [Cryphonectria parasitica EP155]|uniref:WD40 repeat-like protein n=1 Tax=Cryphonectria parasitica (strain ATCC 38755 / EP155) TaxID=660469 RepID=A0A9P5CQC5_CRYP1|nr:WD40 repeat-like protein [Cryphonectria parasitica EP155]KAF3765905.1 WD40 repeat-like protein [Cryphonectria parasitica EP155]
MASTPSRRLKPMPSTPQLFPAPSKSPSRNRPHQSCLVLKRIIGNTCPSPTAFDSSGSSFAYVAGGAVVVIDVQGSGQPSQAFYRARPTAVPVFATAPIPQASPSLNTTPKGSGARKRPPRSTRDSPSGLGLGLGLGPRTWTSRERIKAATCVSLSKDARFLAVGETGYAPRVLVFGLKNSSSSSSSSSLQRPLVSISEHAFGVRAVAWSQDGKWLASLGTTHDGFLFVWKIDPRTGSASLFQQNRCTSYVAGMIWLGSNLITFGLRHMKVWKVVDGTQRPPSPSKKYAGPDPNRQNPSKTLPGRNVLLGSLLEASFTCAVAIEEDKALMFSDGGNVCLLDGAAGQMKLAQVTSIDFHVTSCALRASVERPFVLAGGNDGQLVSIDVGDVLSGTDTCTTRNHCGPVVLAMAFAQDKLVTVDRDRHIDIWDADTLPEVTLEASARVRLPGQNDPVLGIQSLERADETSPVFFTWSGSGRVLLWDLDGSVQESLDMCVDQVYTGEDMELQNQMCVVGADEQGHVFAAGDRVGVLQIVDRADGHLLLKAKAHMSEITHIAVRHDASKSLVATSGRDRTVQLFHRISDGSFNLLQTLAFPARVTHMILSPDDKIITASMDRAIQTHELVTKTGEPGTLAAVQCRSITLKASPTSMALDNENQSLLVSSLDKCVYHLKIGSGRPLKAFRCADETTDTVVLDSLVLESLQNKERPLLIGLSNTDKSVRIYDCKTGALLDREWGHTESISGVAVVHDGDSTPKVVSVGCDGTIMVFDLDLQDLSPVATSRSPSPAQDGLLGTNHPPLRRVLSKAELAGFSRLSSSLGDGRRSPSRNLRSKKSKTDFSSSTLVETPPPPCRDPCKTKTDQTSSRRTTPSRYGNSGVNRGPNSATLTRRPSLPAIGSFDTQQAARKKSSNISLRSLCGPGSLGIASEQVCRQLRAYRKELSSLESVTSDMLAQVEVELQLTSIAISERATRHAQQSMELNKERDYTNDDGSLAARDVPNLLGPGKNRNPERPRTAC